MVDHDTLIDRLSRTAGPVKRPPATGVRAAVWIATVLPCGVLATLLLHTTATDWSQPGAVWAGLELILSFVLGVLAIVTAFDLSIAGRKVAGWRVFVPLMAVWLAAGLAGLAHPVDVTWHAGSGSYCYRFMLLASLPMIAISILGLRRTRTLYPVRSLAIAGLGVAFMTMTLLSLCHAVEGDLPDYIVHLVAAATIVVLTVVLGRRWVAIS